MDIKCRNFHVKFERNLTNGKKIVIPYSNLTKREQTLYHIGVCEVFEKMLVKDDCREAKSVIEYIKGLQ